MLSSKLLIHSIFSKIFPGSHNAYVCGATGPLNGYGIYPGCIRNSVWTISRDRSRDAKSLYVVVLYFPFQMKTFSDVPKDCWLFFFRASMHSVYLEYPPSPLLLPQPVGRSLLHWQSFEVMGFIDSTHSLNALYTEKSKLVFPGTSLFTFMRRWKSI